MWSDRAVDNTGTSNQNNVSLAVGTDDIDLFVGFTSEGDNEIILIAKLLVDVGTPLGTQFVKVGPANTIALSPLLIADINGGFFVAWHEGEHLQPVSIYLGRYNSVFIPVVGSGWVKVADTGNNKDSVHYQMTSDGAGGAVLTWIDGRNASDDVYASKINSLMQPLWGTSGVRVTDSGTNFSVSSPSIVADSVEGAFVSYSRTSNNSSARQARVNYIDPNTSSDPSGGFPSTSAGGSAILQPGTVNLLETSNGAVLSYVGTESAGLSPDKVFAQVFAGAIFPSRIETPVAVSPIANAPLLVNTAFTLSASDFIMAGFGNHASSNIEIFDSVGTVVMSPQFTGASTDFNISQSLASNLQSAQSYSWRVRYTASTGEISARSAPETFLVVAATLPTITGLVNQSLDLSLATLEVSQSFTLSDPAGNVDDVTVTATSSDQTRVADSAISISGSGSNRSITVSPTTGGTVTITVTATSSGGLSASSQYEVSIISAAEISGGLSDRQILLGETTTLTFNIIDGDVPNLNGVQVAAAISDISVIATTGFVINPPAVLNGPTTIDITPLKLGVADITLSMTDSDGHLTTVQFKLTVVNELTTTTPSNGGGGGGSFGGMLICLLLPLFFRRKFKA